MAPPRLAAALLGLALCLGAAHAASSGGLDGESALRQELQQAVWPADIVRLADQYLARYPAGAWAGEAVALRERAGMTAIVLERRDVRLYRGAFQPAEAGATLHEELRRAALGDAAAAVRLARRHLRGDGVAQDANRYVGWLQYASMLGDERASYELALHFRRDAQPVLAAKYEARAVELGFTPPRDLDHSRK